jgi:hypothetical protein
MNRLPALCLLAAAAALSACSSAPPPPADLIAARTQPAAAAPPEGQPLAPWLAAERERIESERQAAVQRFDAAERECWQRFAVNDCLNQARTTRRATLDHLRQEDLALNAVERQRRTAARQRELESKQGDIK